MCAGNTFFVFSVVNAWTFSSRIIQAQALSGGRQWECEQSKAEHWRGGARTAGAPATWRYILRCVQLLATLNTHGISRSVPYPSSPSAMRKPRLCLRVGRPRVTRTPSLVQTTTHSDTRSSRRYPPGLITLKHVGLLSVSVLGRVRSRQRG